MNNVRLEAENLLLEFDKENGSLIKIFSKVSDWDIIKRPYLGLSWRMMIPLPDKRNNEAWGHEQTVKPSCQTGEDFVRFTWNKIESQYGGKHNISVVTECRIKNGQAVFNMEIQNDDNHMVENVYYPYIGDLHRPENAEKFKFERGEYLGLKTEEMYPIFKSFYGTWSTNYPTICVEGANVPPMYPFGLFSDEKGNGLYLGVGERRIETCTWHGEHLPGWKNSNEFRVYDEDFVDGKEVYTRFAVGHLPFIAPDTSFRLIPFVMDAYKGEWSTGALCYKKCSKEWNKLPDNIPEWARNPHAWFQIHINSPEDELRIKYRDLLEVAKECQKYNVKVIQLVGWNKGGQDRRNPSHDPDPRLGTWEDLKWVIGEIKKLGVKLVLFTKFTWADESRENFKKVFEKHAVKDPYGNYYVRNGYQYMTLTQFTNVNTRRLVPMCFGDKEYRDICNEDFMKCVELGADGILFDENETHTPTLCCFDTSHGHRYGASTYGWDEELVRGFRELVKDREFLIAGEASYDFEQNYYDLSYGRTWGIEHKAYSRMIRPNSNIMTAVVGFEDRSMINQCLLNRYIISYEPYNFKGKLSDFPETVAYGNKMDKLRTELREYFWDGEFMDKVGGIVLREDGTLVEYYAVYKGTNGKEGMVICNYDENKSVTVIPKLLSGQQFTSWRLVDDEHMSEFQSKIEIPPQSAIVII